jgi:hypothetical protein
MKHSYFLLTLGLLGLAASASAQTLTNNGAQLTVSSGATLYISGGFENKSGSTLLNNGTVEVTGDVTNAGTVDAAGTGTLSLTGATNQTLTAGGASFANITVNKTTAASNQVNVPSDVTVTGQLTLTSGVVLTAASAKVILGPSATLSGEANGRYVKGNLQTQRTGVSGSADLLLPGGLTLNPGGNNMGTVTATRSAGLLTQGVSYGTNPNNAGAKSIDRIWTITASGTAPSTATPATLTFTWLSDDDNGLSGFGQSQLWRFAAANTGWQRQGGSANASSRSITSTINGVGQFTVSNQNNPLPVELLAFTAERRGTDAMLRWATAQEKNNEGFAVEVSADGRAFRRLGTVAGHGTSTQRHDYEYLDAQIARYGSTLVYYRLRQRDADGTESLSPVRTVNVEFADFAVQALPNPFGGQGLQVTVRSKTAGLTTLQLHDAVGRVLLSQQSELPVGGGVVALDGAGKLATGVYFLTVRQGKQVATLKVVHE